MEEHRRRIAAAGCLLVLCLLLLWGGPAAAGAETCPNQASRAGLSASLPDCRAYELATPELNGSAPSTWPEVEVPGILADGSAIAFLGAGSPAAAEGDTAVRPAILARRGVGGWSTRSLSAPTPLASATYFGAAPSTLGVSAELTQSVLYSDQPLAGPGSPTGANAYLRRADGTTVAITNAGAAGFDPSASLDGASQDFGRLFLTTTTRQSTVGIEDPLLNGNLYEYSAGQLRLVAIVPESSGEEAAPAGGVLAGGALPALSGDATEVLFKANGYPGLYLRSNSSTTVEVSKSQRSSPDPDPPAEATAAGISADGATVLFTSVAKLTDDPGAGPTDDTGKDLYSFDVASGVLTDLTTDTDPIPEHTSAGVEAVLGASPDASYVYFVARGELAPGATSGEGNLYVIHDGETSYVATDPEPGAHFYVTPDGRHAAFTSTAPQGGYENAGFAQAYRYTYGGALECGSCRPGGEPPGADASLEGRSLSDDGTRLFFQSADAILPAAQGAVQNVYEYSDGGAHLLSPGEGAPAILLGASGSGDDVFIASFQALAPQGPEGSFSIYDARVGALVPVPGEGGPGCQGEGCRGPASPTAPEPGPGSGSFEAPTKVAAPEARSVAGSKVRIRVIVPGPGELEVGGRGFDPLRRQLSEAGSVAFTLALGPGADRKRRRFHIFRTEAEVSFRSAAGAISRAGVALTFRGSAPRGVGR